MNDITILQQKSQNGDAEAQYLLAERYLHGNGVKKDEEKAVELYTKSAKQGFRDAVIALSLCYYHGWGGIQDFSYALDLLLDVIPTLHMFRRYGGYGEFFLCELYAEYLDEKVIVVPEGTEKIMKYCFDNAKAQAIFLPDGVQEIKDGAFMHCENLKAVFTPVTVKNVEVNAFVDCPLVEIYCEGNGDGILPKVPVHKNVDKATFCKLFNITQ